MSLLDEVATSPRLARSLAWCQGYFDRPGVQQAIDTQLAIDAGGQVFSTYTPADSITPAVYAASTPYGGVVLIHSTPTARAAVALQNGYTEVWTDAPFAASNRFLSAMTARVNDILRSSRIASGRPLLLNGYSVGGAVAQRLALAYFTSNPAVTPKVITFGQPRAFGRTEGQSLAFTDTCRWMNHDDIVPWVPVTGSGVSLVDGVTLLAINKATLFVQSPGGVQIDGDAQITVRTNPVTPTSVTSFNYFSWLWNALSDASNPHSIYEYQRRFELWCNRNPTLIGDTAAPGGVTGVWGEGEPLTKREWEAMQRNAVNNIAQVQDRQNAQPVDLPQPNQFYVIRTGRTYNVWWNNRVVVVTTRRRSANQAAREGNQFLRSLQHQASVDPNAVADSLQDYLAAATDPNSGFIPPMNTP